MRKTQIKTTRQHFTSARITMIRGKTTNGREEVENQESPVTVGGAATLENSSAVS